MKFPGRSPAWALMRPHRWRVATLAVVSLIGGLCEAAFLIIVTRSALAVADGKNEAGVLAGWYQPIGTALAIAAALIAFRLALSMAGVWLSVSLSLAISNEVKHEIAQSFLEASWAIQQGERSGRLQELMGAYAGGVSGTIASLVNGIVAGLNLLALLAASLVVDPRASIVVLVALLVLGFCLTPIRTRIRVKSQAAAEASMAFSTSVAELGSLGMEMQVFGVRNAFVDRIDALIAADVTARRRATLLQNAIGPIYTSLAYIAILGGLAFAASVGVSELSSVGAVLLVMLRSLTYGQGLQTSAANAAAGLPFIEVVQDTLVHYRAHSASGGTQPVREVAMLSADNVCFEYSPGLEVLSNITFSINVGEVVGVVGPSGSGKTTLVQLLLGLREPTTGSMRVGDVELSTINRTDWAARVSFVPQDAYLFAGSIAENIRFFRTGLSDSDVEEAARMANLQADITAMPAAFDEQVGERGSRLSGGQRQRLSIARSLAGRPQMLILDEPTSALDVKSEALIRETLSTLAGNVTVIIIAHRLSTLEVCDRIMVIQDGVLRGFDAPDVLAATDPFYREALELSGLM